MTGRHRAAFGAAIGGGAEVVVAGGAEAVIQAGSASEPLREVPQGEGGEERNAEWQR